MTTQDILQVALWVSTIFSIAGSIFINRKNSKGFYLFLIANACTIAFDVATRNWAQGVGILFFIYLNFEGIFKWSRKPNQ